HFVDPVQRLLHLRSIPIFRDLSSFDMASLAQRLQERFFRQGELLLHEGEPTSTGYFLVEGHVSVRKNAIVRIIEPPFAAGFLSLLARDPLGVTVKAETDLVTLELGAADLFEGLEDSFNLLEAALRQLCTQISETQRDFECRGIFRRGEANAGPYP